MSTVDTEVFLLASSVAKDFVGRRRELSAKGMARIIRVAMIGVTLPAILLAIYAPDVLDALFIFSSLLVAMFPAVFVSLFRPLPSKVAFASLLIGTETRRPKPSSRISSAVWRSSRRCPR